MPIDLNLRVQQSGAVAVSDVDGDKVILHTENGNILGFNRTAAAIWDAFAEPATCQEVAESLLRRFDVGLSDCTEAVHDVYTKALQAGLLIRVE